MAPSLVVVVAMLLVTATVSSTIVPNMIHLVEGDGLYWRGALGNAPDVVRVLFDLDNGRATFLEAGSHDSEDVTGIQIVGDSYSGNIPSIGGSFRAVAVPTSDLSSPFVLSGELYLPTSTQQFRLSPCNPEHCLPPSQLSPKMVSPFNLTDMVALSQVPAAAVVSASAPAPASGDISGSDVKYAIGRMSAADSRPLWAATPPPSALWSLGESSRLVTATVVGSLVHRGLLSYSDSLTAFFPDAHSSYSNATIAHLLSHRAGLAPRLPGAEAVFPLGPLPPAEASAQRRAYADAALARSAVVAPGTEDLVSHAGYAALGAVIDAVSEEKSFEAAAAAVVAALLDPLSTDSPGGNAHNDESAVTWGCPGQDGITYWSPETVEHPVGHSFTAAAVAVGVLPDPAAVCAVPVALFPAVGAALRLDALQALLRLHATPYNPDREEDDGAGYDADGEAASIGGLYSRLFGRPIAASSGSASSSVAASGSQSPLLPPPRAIAEMHYPAFPGGRFGFGVAVAEDGSYSTAGGVGWVGPSEAEGPSVFGTTPLGASAVIVDRTHGKAYAVLANGGQGAEAVAEYAAILRARDLL